jgi:hypothetical protein
MLLDQETQTGPRRQCPGFSEAGKGGQGRNGKGGHLEVLFERLEPTAEFYF